MRRSSARFQLKVLADGGASAITGSHYLVSTEDGMGLCRRCPGGTVTVVVSEQCRVTFKVTAAAA